MPHTAIPLTAWTIGHSTREFAELAALLGTQGIELVADVRRFPGSRRLPQYQREALEAELTALGISYRWIPELGGRRRPRPDSPNQGWRHPAFRGYADYMATGEFADGLAELMMLAGGLRTAVMCSEAVWWRCHRRLIADILTALGWEVLHIVSARAPERHRLAPPAVLEGGVLSYPAAAAAAPMEVG